MKIKKIKDLISKLNLPEDTEENLCSLLYLRWKIKEFNGGLTEEEFDLLDYYEDWLYELF